MDVTHGTAAHFALKLAGIILRHIFCDTDIEILADLVQIETENIRELIHIEIYWFSFQIFVSSAFSLRHNVILTLSRVTKVQYEYDNFSKILSFVVQKLYILGIKYFITA